MSKPRDEVELAVLMATVHGWGRSHERKTRALEQIRGHLDYALGEAYRAGATVTELAEASGLTRPTVYRAVRPAQRQ